MNRTMVKRGIGAAALAIIAALLLGYLLKGKDQERQDVVDMALPGAQDVKQSLNIPSIGGNAAKDAAKNTSDAVKSATDGADETVIASASALGNAANQNIKTTKTAVNTYENKGKDLDFTIRPPKGERREIIDNIGKSKQEDQKQKIASSSNTGINTSVNNKAQQNTGAISRPKDGSVVASSSSSASKPIHHSTKPAYRPRLVGERERKPGYGIVVAEPTERKYKKHTQTQKKVITTKKKEKTTHRKPTKKTGNYAIQLLATSSSSRANNLKKTMIKEGYDSFVSKTTKNGKILFRVRVGKFASRQAALATQNKMKRRYKKNQYVISSLVVSN